MKKRILSWIVVLSIIVVGLNIGLGIIKANEPSKAFGALIDNQTGEDITAIRLRVESFDWDKVNSFENDMWRSFKTMEPGNYEEFIFPMNTKEHQSCEISDMTITVTIGEEKYPSEVAKEISIKEGKRTLLKLIGNKSSGFKLEFVELL